MLQRTIFWRCIKLSLGVKTCSNQQYFCCALCWILKLLASFVSSASPGGIALFSLNTHQFIMLFNSQRQSNKTNPHGWQSTRERSFYSVKLKYNNCRGKISPTLSLQNYGIFQNMSFNVLCKKTFFRDLADYKCLWQRSGTHFSWENCLNYHATGREGGRAGCLFDGKLLRKWICSHRFSKNKTLFFTAETLHFITNKFTHTHKKNHYHRFRHIWLKHQSL